MVLLGGPGGPLSLTGYGSLHGLFVSSSSTSSPVVGLAAADVNGDGKLDLIAMDSYGTVDILSGNGDGTLGWSDHSYGTGGVAVNFVGGDVNGDGFPDMAGLHSGS